MTLFAHRRTGAPFALVKDQSLPATLDINMGGVGTEVASLSAFSAITTGTETVPITEPSNAQQMFRYRFLTSETDTVFDQTTTGLNAIREEYYGAGVMVAEYGAYFFGISASANRCHFSIPNNAKFGATRTRFIFGLRPEPWGDQYQIYGTIIRAKTVSETYIWSLVRGADNTLLFGTGPDQEGLDTSNCLQIKNFFVDNEHCTIELEIDDQEVRIWKDNVLVSDDYTLPAPITWSDGIMRIGNQGSSGGGPFWGHMSHAAAYTGDLTEGEIRWIRDTAKTMIETAPKILTVPTPPAPRPEGQLTVTRAPSFSVKQYSLENVPINFRSGRASDGIGGPIAQSFTLTLGGVNVKPARGFTFTPLDAGNLVLTDTFDNAIHPPQSVSVTLPIVVNYPTLSAAEIKSRLGGVGDAYIDNFNSGFPADTLWKPDMVCDPGNGRVGMRLLPNNGAGRPNLGGSVQLNFITAAGSNTPGTTARLYNVDFQVQLIDTRGVGQAKGYIQTGFTYQSPYTLPRREMDFEYNSRTGYMECTLHMEPNDAPGTSTSVSILFTPPADAFTGQRTWSITSNADRFQYWYEGTLITQYIRGVGFDSSVQNFALRKRNSTTGSDVAFLPGDTHIHLSDAGWHLNPQNFIIQQWMSTQLLGWLGPNTVPLTHPLLEFGTATAQEFGPENTNLLVGNWTATAIGGGQVRVNVSSYRPARFRPTHLEARVDGGSWVRLAGTTGNQTISGVATGSRNIQLRAVAESLATNPAITASNYTMNANPSDTKTVTVT